MQRPTDHQSAGISMQSAKYFKQNKMSIKWLGWAPARAVYLLLLTFASHQDFIHTRLLPVGAPQDSRALSAMLASPFANDLNRTTAHVQPTTTNPPAQPRAHAPSQRPQAPFNLSNPRAPAGDTPRNATAPVTRSRPTASPSSQRAPLVAIPSSPASLLSLRAKWRQIEQSLADAHNSASAELKRFLDELWPALDGQAKQISGQCRRALDELVTGLAEQELWASQMVDASASHTRLPSGLLEGTLTELGNFDECLAIRYNKGRQRTGAGGAQSATRGQYCSVIVKPPLTTRPRLHTICRRLPILASAMQSAHSSGQPANTPLKLLAQHSHQFHYVGLRLGICVPSRCGQADVQLLVQSFLIRHELIGQVKHCQLEQLAGEERTQAGNSSSSANGWPLLSLDNPIVSSISQKFDLTQQCILFTFLCLAILNVLGTWLDHEPNRPPIGTGTNLCGGGGGTKHAHPIEDSGGPRSLANKRAQQYRVCRSDSITGCSSDDDDHHDDHHDHHHHHLSDRRDLNCRPPLPPPPPNRLKLQRNPLADLACGATAAAATAPAELGGHDHHKQTSLDSLLACKADARRLADRRETLRPMFLERERERLLISTASERAGQPPRSPWRDLLICFSLKRNLRSIGRQTAQTAQTAQTTQTAPSQCMSDLKVVHGLRTLSMIWIIFGHTIGLVSPEMMNNLFPLASLSCSSRLLQAVLNTTLAVDTFFMISGLVTVISFARRCKSALRLVEPSAEVSLPPPRLVVGVPAAQLHVVPNDGGGGGAHGLSGSDDMEVSSVDSSNSVITTSMISSASSNGCVGLSSKSSSQKNFILNKSLRTQRAQLAKGNQRAAVSVADSGWPSDFKPLLWLLMRYLRLTPAYAAIIGLSVLMPSLGSGPFWPETAGQLGQACRANWWANLLYVNNFIETDKLCLIHSWYLSNDWQFYLLALVLFAACYKSAKLCLILLAGAFVASSATTFLVSLEHNYPPTIVTTSPAVDERWEFIHSLYYKPWPHMPSYLVGLIAGLLIARLQLARSKQSAVANSAGASWRPSSSLDLAPGSRLFCWLLSGLISFAVLNSIYPWNMGIQVEPTLAALHSCTFRTLWAACCAWLVFALVSRPRNPLALLLSWHGFQVTSRLTYCAYLVHPLAIYYHFGTIRERIDSSLYGQMHRFLGTLALSYLIAFLVSLVIESPSIQVQRFLANWLQPAGGHTSSGSGTGASPGSKPARHREGFMVTRQQEKRRKCRSGRRHGVESQSEGRGAEAHSDEAVCLHMPGGGGGGGGGGVSLLSGCSQPLRSSRADPGAMIEALAASQRSGACPVVARGECPHAMADSHVAPGSGHNLPDGHRLSYCSSHSAIDGEFQRKLAQAIGRGFKIRSKIVNGRPRFPSAADTGARARPARKTTSEPTGGQGSVGSVSLDIDTGRPLAAAGRRGELMSTFVQPANKSH